MDVIVETVFREIFRVIFESVAFVFWDAWTARRRRAVRERRRLRQETTGRKRPRRNKRYE